MPVAEWLARDPLSERAGINLYVYVMNDPLRFYDPLGEDAVQVGVSGTASGGGQAGTGSAGVAVDGNGNVSVYVTYGGGGAPPAATGADGGVTVQVSNASNNSDLSGIFFNGSGGAGDGEGAANVDVFGGASSDGLVVGGGMTGGDGVGGITFYGATNTIVIPLFNINSVLNFLQGLFKPNPGAATGCAGK
jgi:hypothetical protein